MIRIQALRLFRREFFHAVRNGLSNEDAALQATERVRTSVNEALAREVKPEIDKLEAWADILDVLTEWTILLQGLPIDASKIPPKALIEAEFSDPNIRL